MKNEFPARIEPLESRIAPATIVVTTAQDVVDSGDGVVSLREAIDFANTNSGLDIITFNIPGAGVHRIALTTSLQTITDIVTIDGYTQPGASPNTRATGNDAVLLIELNGTLATGGPVVGIALQAGGSTVRGLVINGFNSSGILINDTAGGQIIEGNFIGTNAAGTAALGNGNSGIDIFDSPNIRIGGASPAARNVIAGNENDAIYMDGVSTDNCIVQGNYLGTNAAGTAAIPNDNDAIFISSAADGTLIGGTSPGAGNLISGNNGYGISFNRFNGSPSNSDVQGNLIGTDATGTLAIANTGGGISVFGANNIRIGGTDLAARNVISGNQRTGIEIRSAESFDNQIFGNFIGANIAGTALPNNFGVAVFGGATDTDIGGSTAGAGNVIAFNAGDGITVTDSSTQETRIIQNAIFSNGLLGIDLADDGITQNDPGDTDTGPSDLQNFPIITTVTIGNTGLPNVSGTLNSTANANFTIHFYLDQAADPSGFGEGQSFLGSTMVSTDGAGNAAFNFVAPSAVPSGTFVSCTATDMFGNTSEFSATRALSTAFVWDGSAGDGNWFTAANWTPEGIPGPTDSVLLDIASTIGLGAAASVASFTQGAGTFTGTADLTVLGSFTWTGGFMSGSGVTHANGGLLLNGGPVQLSGRTLDLPVGHTAVLSGSSASLRFADGALFENAGEFLALNDLGFMNAGGAASLFHNTGTFTRDTSGGDFTIDVPFSNDSTVSVATGGLVFSAGFAQPATGKILGGGTVEFAHGVVSAGGSIAADVFNTGAILNPGGTKIAGTLSIQGTYSQGANGTLAVELAGTTPGSLHDQLIVTGAATLDGTLKVNTLNGFSITAGDTFPILLYGSASGGFAALKAPSGISADAGSSALSLHAQTPSTVASLTFSDADGDLVTLKVNKGAIPTDAVTFGPNGEIQVIDLRAVGINLTGATVTIAVEQSSGGDGLVNVGAINASGMDLKKLTLEGNLGLIDIGSGNARKSALKTLVVNSLGALDMMIPPVDSEGPLVSEVAGALGKLTVKGNVQNAAVSIAGKLGNVTIGGNFTGENVTTTALLSLIHFDRFIPRLAGGVPVGAFSASSIGAFSVKGNMTNGAVTATGNIGSVTVGGDIDTGAVVAEGRIDVVKVLGSMTSADPANPVIVAALGRTSSGRAADALGIDVLKVRGDVENAQILLGYNKKQVPKNPDASVAEVIVGGNWSASSLVAGVMDSTGDGFGRNDAVIDGDSTPSLIARIGSIVIKGTASGSTASGDSYGITAQEIGKLSINGSKVPLSKKAKDDVLLDQTNGDFRLVEV